MRPSRNLFATALLFLVPGCATQPPDDSATSFSDKPAAKRAAPAPPAPALPPTIIPTAYVTIPVEGATAESEPRVLAWLRWQKVRVETDTDGEARVYDSAAARHALVQYRRMLRLRMDTIAQNVANSNTTRDARGELNPYRRKRVAIDDNGNVEIKPDDSPFRTVYDPSHPDADAKGMVKYPNVDPGVEYSDALQTGREYEQVVGMLQHLDPTRVSEGIPVALPLLKEPVRGVEAQITSSSR